MANLPMRRSYFRSQKARVSNPQCLHLLLCSLEDRWSWQRRRQTTHANRCELGVIAAPPLPARIMLPRLLTSIDVLRVYFSVWLVPSVPFSNSPTVKGTEGLVMYPLNRNLGNSAAVLAQVFSSRCKRDRSARNWYKPLMGT